MRQIILDTETTGRETENGHRIIEIGAVVIKHRIITQETFHTYLNPDRESDPEALAVHGLSRAFLEDKPQFSDIIDNFLAFLQQEDDQSELIIHNAPFDLGFLNAEINRLNTENPRYNAIETYCTTIIDSLKLARQLHPNQRNSLDALCKRYYIDNSNRSLHGALLDANLLAQVYLKMTAGQGSLFDMPASSSVLYERSQNPFNSRSLDLPIYYATKEELKEHQAQLLRIKETSGTCLWEE
jgi:DNA polymerase-3 subunit epsilon